MPLKIFLISILFLSIGAGVFVAYKNNPKLPKLERTIDYTDMGLGAFIGLIFGGILCATLTAILTKI